MRIRFLLAVGATLALAACGESTTGPQTMSPKARSSDEVECRNGYVVATRDDGSQYCSEVQSMATRPDSTSE